MMLCSRSKIVPTGVTFPFILVLQSNLHLQGFRDLLCRFTVAELAETILLTTNLVQIILYILDRGPSMVLVLCHKVKIHKVLDAQHRISEGNLLPCWRIQKSPGSSCNGHALVCFHLLTTPLRQPAVLLVELSITRIWRYHPQELVEYVDSGMLFEDGHYPVNQMLDYTDIDGKKNFKYGTSRQRDAFHLPQDGLGGSNRSSWQIFSCFLSIHLIFLSCKLHLLEV